MRALERKIPPVAVWLLAAALMKFGAWAVPAFHLAVPAARVIAVVLAIAGTGICVFGVVSFRCARTTVNPRPSAKSSALVTAGIYQVSRNPMYLGFLVILLAWAFFLSNVVALLLLAPFVLYLNRWQIAPEEEALALQFGPEFATYKTRVRRWL